MTDWEKIKTEYLSGNTSYRKLAAKYGIPRTRIEERGRQEDWPWLRESLKHDSFPLLHDSLCEKNSRSAQKIMDVADKILDKISESLDALSTIDGNTLKHFTAALKELRDIKGIKSDADIREQLSATHCGHLFDFFKVRFYMCFVFSCHRCLLSAYNVSRVRVRASCA